MLSGRWDVFYGFFLILQDGFGCGFTLDCNGGVCAVFRDGSVVYGVYLEIVEKAGGLHRKVTAKILYLLKRNILNALKNDSEEFVSIANTRQETCIKSEQ